MKPQTRAVCDVIKKHPVATGKEKIHAIHNLFQKSLNKQWQEKSPGRRNLISRLTMLYLHFRVFNKNRNKRKHGRYKEKGKCVRSHIRKYVVNTEHD